MSIGFFNRLYAYDSRDKGFSLPEILVVIVILGVLAAIAIPVSVSQQAKAVDASIKSDLTTVAAGIETQLMSWRGAPPEALNICHTSPNYPLSDQPSNSCEDGEWGALKSSNNGALDEELEGKLSPGVVVQGIVAADGSYCLDGSSTRAGSKTFYFDSISSQVQQGTCAGISWVPEGNIVGSTLATTEPSDLPPPPAGVSAEISEDNVATIKWDAQAGSTYAIKVTGQPTKTFNATTTGQATCVFPAETCEGPSTGFLVGGFYTATVRAGNSEGWGPGTNTDFSIAGSPITMGGGGSSALEQIAAPTITGAVISGTGQVTLSWSPPDGVTSLEGYRIRYSNDNGTSWNTPIPTMSTATTYLLEDLPSGRSYLFQVQGVSDTGIPGLFSSSSNVVNLPINSSSAPDNVVSTVSDRQVILNWNAPSDSGGSAITAYRVNISPSAGSISYAGTAATITGLTNGTTYTFTIQAQTTAGWGANSIAVQATPYGTPGNVASATAIPGYQAVALSWAAATDSGGSAISSYVVEYRIAGTSTWTQFGTFPSTTLSAMIQPLQANTDYNFRILTQTSTGSLSTGRTVNSKTLGELSATGGSITTITQNGVTYKVHTFLSNGTFSLNNIPSDGAIVEYLVVGGGGGGGSDMGGGGGAGGYRAGTALFPANSGNISITIGAGGGGGWGRWDRGMGAGRVGGDSSVIGAGISIVAAGGGGGATRHNAGNYPATIGGSGGGGQACGYSVGKSGIPGQGNKGGTGIIRCYYPGGGGGAGAPGANGTPSGAHGGSGIRNSINGSNLYWAGGGGASGHSGRAGNGGLGGGGGGGAWGGGGGSGGGLSLNSGRSAGNCTSYGCARGGAGGANTGGGGGGGNHGQSGGGNGGSGIVILRYAITAPPQVKDKMIAIGGDITSVTENGVKYNINIFRSSGSLNIPTNIGGPTFVEAEYLVIGGGGGGGSDMGGGGGAGGYRAGEMLLQAGNSYNVTVGGGGGGGWGRWDRGMGSGRVGGNSSITGGGYNIVALGGGGGATRHNAGNYPASSGGSGGGGQACGYDRGGAQGIAGQGFPGGSGILNCYYPGGGGGASGPGQDGSTGGGHGGPGKMNTILGYPIYWAGGGGASGHSGRAGNGGLGGGGAGGAWGGLPGVGGGSALVAGLDATSCTSYGCAPGGDGGDGTGGGGGGGNHGESGGGRGGSGIVIVKYPAVPTQASSSNLYAVGGDEYEYSIGSTKYRAHIFTSNSAFQILPGNSNTSANYLVVGGGGGGGSDMGGGGGAGGMREGTANLTAGTTYSIMVGSGGNPGWGRWDRGMGAGGRGGNSSITGGGLNIVALGGGGGATRHNAGNYPASSGGSGGGGQACNYSGPGAGTSGQGNAGGRSGFGCYYPGGGGGAGTVGGQGNPNGGHGGTGRPTMILGNLLYFAGGGGGAGHSGKAGNGGFGGGGGGGAWGGSAGVGGGNALSPGNGKNNCTSYGCAPGGDGGNGTGGGGGGGNHGEGGGGRGGSGIVILRYAIQ